VKANDDDENGEVNDSEEQDPTRVQWALEGHPISGVHLTSNTNLEEKLLSNMSLDDIHNIFSASSSWNWIEFSDPGTILLGSHSCPKVSCAHLFNPFSEISLSDSLGLPDVVVGEWEEADSYTHALHS
jgi:sugar lactone lactonase YvrE